MNSKYYYIVTASGVGKRMNLDLPKQFHEVNGEPIIIKTLRNLLKSKLVDGIIVPTNEDYINHLKELFEKYNVDKIIDVVSGGKERQDSIYNAINRLDTFLDENKMDKSKVILGVQDAVRPNIELNYIDEPYKLLNKDGSIDGVVIAVKSKDTIKIVDKDGYITSTPDRQYVYNAQTPQVFRFDIIKKAYDISFKDNYYGTDDSSLVERINGRVKIMEGSYNNVKITTPEDLKHFE